MKAKMKSMVGGNTGGTFADTVQMSENAFLAGNLVRFSIILSSVFANRYQGNGLSQATLFFSLSEPSPEAAIIHSSSK